MIFFAEISTTVLYQVPSTELSNFSECAHSNNVQHFDRDEQVDRDVSNNLTK